MKRFFLGLVVCLLAGAEARGEILSYTLTTSYYAYRDTTTHCTYDYWTQSIGFSVQISGGKAVAAAMRSHLGLGLLFAEKVIDYRSEELAKFEFYQDTQGRKWIKTLPMSGRLLSFAFYETRSGTCSPPYYSNQLIATVGPWESLFQFDTKAMETGGASESQRVDFSGSLQNGVPYAASLRWRQQKDPSP